MYRMVMAAWGSQAIRALAGLSVAEHLEERPLGVEQLATRESVDPAMLYRLLRVGVAMDVLNYDDETQTFSTTPMLRVLHEDASESLKHYAQALPGPAFWHAAERGPRAIAVGCNQSVDVLGSTLFDYFGEHPGNFVEPLPAADIYLLKFMLHDWDDRACPTLLENVCHAMNPGARLFIVEMVVEDNAASMDAALMDMVMLCYLTGQELDLPHFNSLIAEAGLRTVDVRALRGSYRVI